MKYVRHAEIMKEIIDDLQITQGQLAKRLGWTSGQFVNTICRGKARIPPSKFVAISKISHISVEELLNSYMHYERALICERAKLKC